MADLLNWTYDGVANRTSETLSPATATPTTTPARNNELASLTQGGTTIRAFSYDGAGNLIADLNGSTTYTYGYNNSGRLVTLTVGSTQTSSYVYDGLERLAIDASPYVPLSGITQFVYDQAGHLLAESDDSGNTLTEYVWLDDMPIALVANVNINPSLYYVHVDHLDRPIMMTDANKSIVWQASYNPFGDANSITGPATNNLRFPGQYFLMEDGLHYNWYRHYDPTIGRYTQPDPLRDVAATSTTTNVNSIVLALLLPSIAAEDWQDGKAAPLPTPGAGDIAAELPEFNGGPSIFGYARENPMSSTDRNGLQASAACALGGPANPACEVGIAIDVAKVVSPRQPAYLQCRLAPIITTGTIATSC
jgi:RHS repeat-associated protein